MVRHYKAALRDGSEELTEVDSAYLPPMVRYCLLVVSVLLCTCVRAQSYGPVEDVFGEDSRWMVPPTDAEETNQWLEWKTEIYIDSLLVNRSLRIAVDSKYWLYINDTLRVFEGQLRRGPTPKATYYDTLDVTPYLHAGRNTVYLLQWYWGKEGFSHKSSGLAGLLFHLDGVKLDARDWKVRRHPAYGQTGEPHPNFRLPESNVRYDARRTEGQWARPQVQGLPGGGPWGPLWPRPFPQWFDSGLLAYPRLDTTRTDSVLTVRAYLPRNITITPYFDVTAPEGKTVDLRTDNYRGGGPPNVRGEYVTRAGRQQFEQLAFMNGHYVVYTFPAGTEIHRLAYRETRYPANYVGHFYCDDPALNTLWEKALTTLNVNLRDGIQDSPERERAQWWGDVVIVMEELFYVADSSALPLIRKAISNLVEWQKEDGALYSPVPAGNWKQELPTQMLASVGSMPTYFAYTNDTATLAYVYPAFKTYMDLWAVRENGLVEERRGGWTWLDWGQNLDSTALYNVWYHKALISMDLMENVLNIEADTRRRIADHRAAFNRELGTDLGYRSPAKRGPIDDRPQGIALTAGLVDSDYYATVARVLDGPYHASPYSEKYILEALFEMDRAEAALHRMKERYRKQIEHPDYTTLWEGWGIGAEGYGGGTYNHGWSGGPMTLLSKYVAGVQPAAPGYKAFRVAPQPGGLSRVTATVPSARGLFTVDYRIEGGTMNMHVTVPPGIGGEIVLPEGYAIEAVNYISRQGEGNRWVVHPTAASAVHIRASTPGSASN
jgi:hypothetical protein